MHPSMLISVASFIISLLPLDYFLLCFIAALCAYVRLGGRTVTPGCKMQAKQDMPDVPATTELGYKNSVMINALKYVV